MHMGGARAGRRGPPGPGAARQRGGQAVKAKRRPGDSGRQPSRATQITIMIMLFVIVIIIIIMIIMIIIIIICSR